MEIKLFECGNEYENLYELDEDQLEDALLELELKTIEVKRELRSQQKIY